MLKHSYLTSFSPIELKFYVKTSYDNLIKMHAKYFGRMAKLATGPINTPFKNLLLQNQKADDLGTWYLALRM